MLTSEDSAVTLSALDVFSPGPQLTWLEGVGQEPSLCPRS